MYPYLTYPLYIAGGELFRLLLRLQCPFAGSILLSNSAARKIALGARYLKYYPFDDIFVAFVAKLLDIPPTVRNFDLTLFTYELLAE